MGKHHLAVGMYLSLLQYYSLAFDKTDDNPGTWTPPGAIFTFEFDDETLELKLIKRTEIPEDEPISWMALSVWLHSDIVKRMLTGHESSTTKRRYMAPA
jgi:hypothetical protein